MVANNYGILVGFDDERTLAATAFNGSYKNIGSALTKNPVLIIFDNQTNVAVPLSVNGSTTWRTFPIGEALVLDLRANKGLAANYSIGIGTQFSTNATVGTTGNMSISLIYAV